MEQSPAAKSTYKLRYRLKELYRSVTGAYQLKSFSQEGEDRILARIFDGQSRGFYVDVGAHHPLRFSNTYLFYQQGWSGINIDANPGSMEAFVKRRPRDINLELGVGPERAIKTLYQFSDPALNSFDPELSKSRDLAKSPFRVTGTSEVAIRPLAEILEENLPPGRVIDFLTVDVEGLDLAVIQSNDWSRFRPTYVLIEELGLDFTSAQGSKAGALLRSFGYSAFAKTVNTVFFRKEAR